MSAASKECRKCGIPLENRNVTGLCKRHWRQDKKPEDAEFIKLAYGKTAGEVAKVLGVHSGTVRNWAFELGVSLSNAVTGRPPTRRPMSVIRNPETLVMESGELFPPDQKRWCMQCERRVFVGEAIACKSSFCKVRVAA